jgi:hypothetical protein
MLNLLALPRATWKARVTFGVFTVITIMLMAQQWSGIHDTATVSRWFAWIFIVGCALSLPRMLIVVLFGRVPKIYAGFAATTDRAPPSSDDNPGAPGPRRTGSREL